MIGSLSHRIIAVLGLSAVCAGAPSAGAADEPTPVGGQAVIRRLAPSQYAHTIRDVFGEGIKIGGRFEPDMHTNGLLAVGAGQVSVTAAGFEQYHAMARSISAQVVDKAHRETLVGCKPAAESAPDDACAQKFLAQTGRLLFRRPLAPTELDTQVAVAREASATLKDFYAGLGVSLTNLLVSPMFLFRQEAVEPDPTRPGQLRLDAYARASRLSLLLWDSAPDDALLRAAETGELSSESGWTREVNRLLNSPRLESGVRAFFADMLGFDKFATLSKDAVIYPKFTGQLIEQAQEQTLRTVVDHVLAQRGDYRDLFTTRRTFLTPSLGMLYAVPVVVNRPINTPDRWVPIEYPAGDAHSGILTQASFVALYSHPGRSSPTLRGKALREVFLCQKVPQPPGNVDFTAVQNTAHPVFKTARDRVTVHLGEPVCAGCHKITDPIGLALENFDSAGGFRVSENGAVIDTSGELNGAKFSGATGLGQAVHDNPATTSCIVNRVFSYATGMTPGPAQADTLKFIEQRFASKGYRLPELLKDIVTGRAFYQVDGPRANIAKTAQLGQ